MKNIKNLFGSILLGLFCVSFFFSCQNNISLDGYDQAPSSRLNRPGEINNQDEQANQDNNANPEKKPTQLKIVAFEGAMTHLMMYGANALTEDIENDALANFAGYGKTVLKMGMKCLDGIIDFYTLGFYKGASTTLFGENTSNPQLEALQQSIDKVQDSVNDIKADLSNLSADLKYEFDGLKVSNRLQTIEEQKAAFAKIFTIMEKYGQQDKEIDLMTYYELKKYAIEAFGSVDKMRQAIQNFYTSFYSGDEVATRSYGESFRIIAEELLPWRYQSAVFMDTLIAQELYFGSQLLLAGEILLDPENNANLLIDLMVQQIKENSIEGEQLEKLIKENASSSIKSDEVFDKIMAILSAYWGSDISTDTIRKELLYNEITVTQTVWNKLVESYSEYVDTLNGIEIPVDKVDEITCNIRGVKCTFSKNIGSVNYSFELKRLAGFSVKNKTEENWKRLYKTGFLPDEKTSEYVKMLSAAEYQKILDFYNSKKLVVTDSDGNPLETNLYNIFRYDADMTLWGFEPEEFLIACYDDKQSMGFIVSDERSDKGFVGDNIFDYGINFGVLFDGLHFWKVEVPAIKGNASSAKVENQLLLEDMAARTDNKACINRVNYYKDSFVSRTEYFIPNVLAVN